MRRNNTISFADSTAASEWMLENKEKDANKGYWKWICFYCQEDLVQRIPKWRGISRWSEHLFNLDFGSSIGDGWDTDQAFFDTIDCEMDPMNVSNTTRFLVGIRTQMFNANFRWSMIRFSHASLFQWMKFLCTKTYTTSTYVWDKSKVRKSMSTVPSAGDSFDNAVYNETYHICIRTQYIDTRPRHWVFLTVL